MAPSGLAIVFLDDMRGAVAKLEEKFKTREPTLEEQAALRKIIGDLVNLPHVVPED